MHDQIVGDKSFIDMQVPQTDGYLSLYRIKVYYEVVKDWSASLSWKLLGC